MVGVAEEEVAAEDVFPEEPRPPPRDPEELDCLVLEEDDFEADAEVPPLVLAPGAGAGGEKRFLVVVPEDEEEALVVDRPPPP